jgi:hypothetical protein
LLLAPAHSCYPFLYTTCKRPLSTYVISTSLNCNPQNYCPATRTSLNCNPQDYHPVTSTSLNCQCSRPLSSMTLNCRLTQTTHDMPSSHVGHLSHLRHLGILGHWMHCSMPSGPCVKLPRALMAQLEQRFVVAKFE